MWYDATTGIPQRFANLKARLPKKSGVAMWNSVGRKEASLLRAERGRPSDIRYSDRPGAGIEGTDSSVP